LTASTELISGCGAPLFTAKPMGTPAQHGGRAPDQFGGAYQLVSTWLGQDRDINRLVRRHLFLDFPRSRVFDHQLVARRFLESRSELLQHRVHGAGAHHVDAGAHHVDFCRAGRASGKAAKQRQNDCEQSERDFRHLACYA